MPQNAARDLPATVRDPIVGTLRLVLAGLTGAGMAPRDAFAAVHGVLDDLAAQADADGTLDPAAEPVWVEDLKPDDVGITAIRHHLGTEHVHVEVYAGAERREHRAVMPIDRDEVEVITTADVTRALVTPITED